jgi:hypothetical protein
MVDPMPAGSLESSQLARSLHNSIQANRGRLGPMGVVLLPLDFATYTVTAGAVAGDTFRPKVVRADGTTVYLTAAAVPWDTSDDATADAIVAAIRAHAANHRYWPVKTDTDDFSVFQRRHDADAQAVEFVMEEVGDAAGTLVDFTDEGQLAAIPVTSGEADNVPSTYVFYELGVDFSQALDLNETGTPRATKVKITSAAAQPWGWWHGMFNPTALDLTGAVPVEAEVEESLETLSSMTRPATGATGYILSFDSVESDILCPVLYI